MLFTCKNFVFQFYVEKYFLLQERGKREASPCPLPLSPFSTALIKVVLEKLKKSADRLKNKKPNREM